MKIYLVQEKQPTRKFIVEETHLNEFLGEYDADNRPTVTDISNELVSSWYEI